MLIGNVPLGRLMDDLRTVDHGWAGGRGRRVQIVGGRGGIMPSPPGACGRGVDDAGFSAFAGIPVIT